MKKAKVLLLLFCMLGGFSLKTQTQTSSPPALIVDTLHYYFNKYYFKTGNSNINTYPYLQVPAVVSSTEITHVGSKFEVPAGETLTVTGIEAFMKKGKQGEECVSDKVVVELSLCNLNSNGMPILPAVDVVTFQTTSLHENGMNLLGGNFSTPHVMTSDFALLFLNASQQSGDTIRLMKTAGRTPTSSAASGTNLCSDGGYGFVRYNSVFYTTRDFTMSANFGNGTDYEFVIAPRVTYTVQSGQIMPDKVYLSTNTLTAADTMCTRTELTFTNTSSRFFEHRMYNLNHFYLKWALTGPFQAQPLAQGGFSQDSAITWRFEAYDLKGEPERVFLPYVNNGTASFVTDRPSSFDPPDYCYLANQFRTRLRPMSIYGRVPMLVHDENFKMCLKFCNDGIGIEDVPGFEHAKVFPNPALNGKTVIRGLKGENTLTIYDLMGRLVSKQESNGTTASLNLEGQPAGTYFVEITNLTLKTSVSVRVIKQD